MLTEDELSKFRDDARRLKDPDTNTLQSLSLALWLGERVGKLLDHIDEQAKENERLLEAIADPQILGMHVDERSVEISVRPREEIMRYLFVMLSHAIGDSKNFVECAFGPDPKTGRSYVLTLRYFDGKTPAQVHKEQIKRYRDVLQEIADCADDAFDYSPRLASIAKAALAKEDKP